MNKKLKAALAGLAFVAGCEVGIALQLVKMIRDYTIKEAASKEDASKEETVKEDTSKEGTDKENAGEESAEPAETDTETEICPV